MIKVEQRSVGNRIVIKSSLGWVAAHPTRRASEGEVPFILETLVVASGFKYDVVNMPGRNPYAVCHSK